MDAGTTSRPDALPTERDGGPRKVTDPGIADDDEGAFLAVGRLVGGASPFCGATLVGERVALTSSRCVRWKSCEEPTCQSNLGFELGGERYGVVRIRSWLRTASPRDRAALLRDAALIELDQDVPASVAAPMVLSNRRPASGARVEHVTFECASRCLPRQEVGRQQVVRSRYGAPSHLLCPGDSGGPIVAEGRVFAVHSGVDPRAGDDVYADLVALLDPLLDTLEEWRARPWSPRDATAHENLRSCEACTGAGSESNPHGFWCVGGDEGELCRATQADADGSCRGGRLIRYQEDCAAPPQPTFEPQGCESEGSCRDCLARAGCGWSSGLGCVAAPEGAPPVFGPEVGDWITTTLCCPEAACDEDGTCEPGRGEHPEVCSDCAALACAPDGLCEGEENPASCPTDCRVDRCDGDSICDLREGESCALCPDECACSGGGTETGCRSTERLCNGRCVDITLDAAHCGECGRRCGLEERCVASRCTPPDAPPTGGGGNVTPTGPEDTLCTNTCIYASDGACDDGGPDASYSACAYGTDCEDCGARPDVEVDPDDPEPPPTGGDPTTDGCGFADVAGHPAESEICILVRADIARGFADDTFRPNAIISRAEFAALLASSFAESVPPSPVTFSDIPATYWAGNAIARAVAAGFLSGYPDGTFRPMRPMSRQEMLVSLSNGRGLGEAPSGVLSGFEDASDVASWARDPVARSVHAGLTGNMGLHPGVLRPTTSATRADACSYLERAGAR